VSFSLIGLCLAYLPLLLINEGKEEKIEAVGNSTFNKYRKNKKRKRNVEGLIFYAFLDSDKEKTHLVYNQNVTFSLGQMGGGLIQWLNPNPFISNNLVYSDFRVSGSVSFFITTEPSTTSSINLSGI